MPHPRDLRRGCRTLHHRIPEVSERQRFSHEHSRRERARVAQAEAEANRQAAERARSRSAGHHPAHRGRASAKEEAAREARSNAFCNGLRTAGFEVLQQFATPAVPARKRYRFWVDFTRKTSNGSKPKLRSAALRMVL